MLQESPFVLLTTWIVLDMQSEPRAKFGIEELNCSAFRGRKN